MIRMEEKQPAGVHRFSLENRRKAVITGVQDIHSFNENEVLLLSEAGKILLKGEQLHVRNLNLEKGEVDLSGNIDSVAYSEAGSRGKNEESLFGKLFR